MKIFHCADIHLGELTGPVIAGENARMIDTVRCMSFVAQKAREEQPDVILISGDLFHKSKLWADQMLKEIAIAAKWLRELTAVAPTVLLFGTHNHDNLKAFETIKEMGISNLVIAAEPGLFSIVTNSGPLQIGAIPGFDKGYFRSKYPGMDKEDENKACSQLLGEIVLGLGAQLDPVILSVLMSHYTIVGCQLDNGEHVFLQSDIVLPKEAIAAAPFDLVCLGHIHKAQEVPGCGRPVYYSGSLNRISFNEEIQDKGFWIHDLQNRMSHFIKTPARKFHTEIWGPEDVENFISGLFNIEGSAGHKDIKDAIVRVHYECNDETNKQFNKKVIKKALYDAGAFYVAEIKPAKITTALVKQEMSENDGVLENLKTWAEREGIQSAEIGTLVELAAPLLATVSAKMPSGKLSGVFEPKILEVKNYRSYKEESFDFGQIFFATVNGPNGIGKSAFFMDAICDCLFEEPRSGEIGSWITSGTEVKSGAISFEFRMGDTDWKVIRTRTKSGKITLALQQFLDGQWVDKSAQKVKDTQEQILALLGMDCATFRCVALIMQDNYGLFMEADKTERMEVLANILGLNVYEQLHELAKSQVTVVNRSLDQAKNKLVELEEKLTGKHYLLESQQETEKAIESTKADIDKQESGIKELEGRVKEIELQSIRLKELEAKTKEIEEEIRQKNQFVQDHNATIEKKKKMLECEEQINQKAQEYLEIKDKVLVLQAKEPSLKNLKAEWSESMVALGKVRANIKKLEFQINEVKQVLAGREEVEKAAEDYKHSLPILEGLEKQKETYEKLVAQRSEVDKQYTLAVHSLEMSRKSLENEIKTLQDKAAMLADANCVDIEKAQCKFLIDAKKAKEKLAEAVAKLNSLDKTEIEKWEGELEKIDLLINQNGYESTEYTRLQEVVEGLKPKAELAVQLEAKTELLNTLETQLTQAREQEKELAVKESRLTLEIEELSKELQDLPTLLNRLPKLESWKKAQDDLPLAKQAIENAEVSIALLEQEISVKKNQVEELEKEIVTISKVSDNLEKAKTELDDMKTHLKVIQEKEKSLHTQIGVVKAKLEALASDEEEKTRIVEEMKPAAAELVRYQTLTKAFGTDGIPFSIVRSVVPELSAMANDILGQMTGGKMALDMRTERIQKSNKKEVNALEIFVTDWRGNIPYKDRSGGQKVKAALANAFALADLKARRAGIQLGMMFVDEPPFLDAEGVDAYCDALELLSQRYPNMRVIAISHDPRMKARFPQEIEVLDMGEEGSKVRIS